MMMMIMIMATVSVEQRPGWAELFHKGLNLAPSVKTLLQFIPGTPPVKCFNEVRPVVNAFQSIGLGFSSAGFSFLFSWFSFRFSGGGRLKGFGFRFSVFSFRLMGFGFRLLA